MHMSYVSSLAKSCSLDIESQERRSRGGEMVRGTNATISRDWGSPVVFPSQSSMQGQVCPHKTDRAVSLVFSVHIEIALQDALLKGVRLATLRLGRSGRHRRGLSGGGGHFSNGFGGIVARDGGIAIAARGRGGHGRAEGERGPGSVDGTFSSGPKLLGPVEALV